MPSRSNLCLALAISSLCGLYSSLRADLVADWPFDGSLEDASGKDHHGTQVGRLSYEDDRLGNARGALRLHRDQLGIGGEMPPGTHIAIDTRDGAAGLPASDGPEFSVAFWVRGEPQDGRTIYSETSSASSAIFTIATGVGAAGDKARVFVRRSAGQATLTVLSSATVMDSAWHHVAVTLGGNTYRLYLDGELDGVGETNIADRDPLDIATIGTVVRSDGPVVTSYFVGDVDHLRVFDHALSAGEIQTLAVNPPSVEGPQRPGDGNQDGALDLSDAVFLLRYLFAGHGTLPCSTVDGNLALLDSTGNGVIDLSDAISIVLYLFQDGPPPVLGRDCVEILSCPPLCAG